MDATFSSLSSSPADPRTPRQKVPNHPFSFSPPSRSPRSIASPSAPSSPISSPSTPLVYLPDPSPTNLAHAPLQLNWYSLYRDRLELEKRWAGTAAALPSATPDSSPSTPPYPAYPHTLVPAPLASHPSLENTMPCQPPQRHLRLRPSSHRRSSRSRATQTVCTVSSSTRSVSSLARATVRSRYGACRGGCLAALEVSELALEKMCLPRVTQEACCV